MDEKSKFYSQTLSDLIPDKNASILVCGGGSFDKNVLEAAGYTNVTISNLDTRILGTEYTPYHWKYENAESLSFPDGAFDYTIIHAAIHHASSPHRVVTEMYRVASKGSLAFESRDSVVMRLLEKFELVQAYEHAAVYYNDCKFGGVNNSEIPNYVYRWTEREFVKTIQSYAPSAKHNFQFRYGTSYPCTPELENKGSLKSLILKIGKPFYSVFIKAFPKQQNLFAFYVQKPQATDALFPWLYREEGNGDIRFSKPWGEKKYRDPNTLV